MMGPLILQRMLVVFVSNGHVVSCCLVDRKSRFHNHDDQARVAFRGAFPGWSGAEML